MFDRAKEKNESVKSEILFSKRKRAVKTTMICCTHSNGK